MENSECGVERKISEEHIKRALADFKRFNENPLKWAYFECAIFPGNGLIVSQRVTLEVGNRWSGKKERANATYYYFLISGEVFVHVQGHP